jgi:hypothetical protein
MNENQKYCLCGCGLLTKPGNRFITGHNSRIPNFHKKRKPVPVPRLCACGCGRTTKPGNKFIYGHVGFRNGNSWKPKPLVLEHPCECGCGQMVKPGRRFINLHQNRNKNNPMYGKKGKLCPLFGKPNPGASKPGSLNHMYGRIGELAPMYGKKGELAPMTGVIRTPEQRMGTSIGLKKLWQNKEYKEKQIKKLGKALHIHPNKPETIILNLLEELYPGQWKFTGDFSFVINGKNPDFVNCNGQKKIIEFFGDYWHKGENPEDRRAIFSPFGYDTLIIWGRELKNISRIKFKIHCFMER